MNLFEFLMILLSLIIGLGLAEILAGFARFLKSDGAHEFSWTHSAVAAIVFLALLQTFWESWGLRSIEEWSFPAMLLMLASPTFLYLIAHVIFPERDQSASLEDYYYQRARLIWALAGLTVIVSTLFRPLAFDMPLWVIDNATNIPTLAVCLVLGVSGRRWLHRVLVPAVLLIVLLDTLAISYTIG